MTILIEYRARLDKLKGSLNSSFVSANQPQEIIEKPEVTEEVTTQAPAELPKAIKTAEEKQPEEDIVQQLLIGVLQEQSKDDIWLLREVANQLTQKSYPTASTEQLIGLLEYGQSESLH
jgi:hypothetical protein